MDKETNERKPVVVVVTTQDSGKKGKNISHTNVSTKTKSNYNGTKKKANWTTHKDMTKKQNKNT